MKIKEKESLSKYTTFKMGGIAEKMYFPESVEELIELAESQPEILGYMIGGGSNLLINDQKEFKSVLCLRNFNEKLENQGNGRYYIGASVRLQKVIQTINADGFGGIEYLYSVPGLIGGAIYMNAGRGKNYHKCISDYLVSVEILKNGKKETIEKKDCGFDYRTSAFQTMENCIVLGALFQFETMPQEESAAKVQERIDLCKQVQDNSAPNYGTVFCESNKYIMALVRKLHVGYKNGCTYSAKTKNWMLKGKEGTFEQAVALLEKVKKWHKLLGQKCRTEVRIWE